MILTGIADSAFYGLIAAMGVGLNYLVGGGMLIITGATYNYYGGPTFVVRRARRRKKGGGRGGRSRVESSGFISFAVLQSST